MRFAMIFSISLPRVSKSWIGLQALGSEYDGFFALGITTTKEDFHLGWCVPSLMDALTMAVISSGAVVSAHFSILYPIPVEPGADVLEVDLSVSSISLKVTGSKRLVLWLVPSNSKQPEIGWGGASGGVVVGRRSD